MGSMSVGHWLIVAVVALLFFGPKRLADVGKGLGEGLRNFKKGLSDDDKLPPKDDDESKRQLSSGPSQSS